MTDHRPYTALQIALHWLVALLVVATWFLGDGMGRLLHQKLDGTYTGGTPLHVVLGLSVLAVVAIRVVVRLMQGAPAAPEGTTGTHAQARHWGHLAIYALLVLVPLGGLSAWYLGLGEAGDIHALAANALLIIAGLHAAMALWHQYVRHDGTLMRMLKPGA